MSERRRSRASFTASLVRLCKCLDENNEASLQWRSTLLRRNIQSKFILNRLWVVGSYARGAPDCGDLDLVAELHLIDGALPDGKKAARALFNSPKDIRLYVGTPDMNESGVAFSEAVLIWQTTGYCWSDAIVGITVDNTAKRFDRQINRIPFRPEQLYCELEQLEEIVDLEKRKIISWKFTELDEVVPAEPSTEDERELIRVMTYKCGQKTRKLLPQILSYLQEQNLWPRPFLRADIEKATFKYGGAKVLIGYPTVPLTMLNSITTSQIIIVPHYSSRGPNGFWLIERGENHPLARACKSLKTYCLVTEDREPCIFSRLNPSSSDFMMSWTSARSMDLFTSKRLAQIDAKELGQDFDEIINIRELTPNELLTCLSQVDVACVNNRDYALTFLGKVATEVDQVCATENIFKILSV